MEEWTVRDDRPSYYRPAESSRAWLVPAIAIALIAAFAAAIAWWQMRGFDPWWAPDEAPPAAQAQPPAPQLRAEPSPPPAAPAEVRHPLPAPEKAPALPTLEMSDTMVRHALVDLIGRNAFDALVRPVELIRRIVATIDNLPRAAAPRRMMPVKDVPGAFAATRSGEQATLAAANFARYAPFVQALQSVDSRALVSTYVRAYPLFQKAYRELGYPAGNFNDRLVEAIDDMLAAPELEAPIKLARPKVLYEFADPDLETRSAGQKILIRMGGENAARVKAKLREIRRELIAASER